MKKDFLFVDRERFDFACEIFILPHKFFRLRVSFAMFGRNHSKVVIWNGRTLWGLKKSWWIDVTIHIFILRYILSIPFDRFVMSVNDYNNLLNTYTTPMYFWSIKLELRSHVCSC